MPNILEKAKSYQSGKLMDGFRSLPHLSYEHKNEGIVNPLDVDSVEVYSLKLTAISKYYISKTLLNSSVDRGLVFLESRRLAEEKLLYAIYKEILELMSELAENIYKGDRIKCFDIIKQIHEEIGI